MELIDTMNSDEFDLTCSWFEDASGKQLNLMANRTPTAHHVPEAAVQMRIDASTWVRPGDSFDTDIQLIYELLKSDTRYTLDLSKDAIRIRLNPNS
ncbi:MAG: hypothetical protein GC159_14570 [Phycisphaera sp.]|nr:hypothetical protein [Phycisphaera sp.]